MADSGSNGEPSHEPQVIRIQIHDGFILLPDWRMTQQDASLLTGEFYNRA